MNCLFVKVFLYAYPRMRALAEAVSAAVENKAVLSFRSMDSALTAAEKIVDEMLLQRNIDGAADCVERVLKTLSDEELFFLEYKYFRRKRLLKEQFTQFSPFCSERNYYRKQAALLRKITFLLAAQGWTEQRFFEAFGEFPFFMKMYRLLSGGKEQRMTAKRNRTELKFQKSVCSSECRTGGFLPRSTKNATAMAAAHTTQMTAISIPESPLRGEVCSPPFSPSPEAGTR